MVQEKAAQSTESSGRKLYDLVFIDCFEGGGRVPVDCRSAAFYTSLRALMKPRGKLLQNVSNSQVADVKGTLASAKFDDVVARDLPNQKIVVASNPASSFLAFVEGDGTSFVGA